MNAATRKMIRCVLRRLVRGSVCIAVLSKLLVPIGYMPSALADGGPIALCNVGLPPGFLELRHHAPDDQGAPADGRGAPAHDHGAPAHDHGAPAHDHGAMPHDHGVAVHGHGESTGGDGGEADHGPWERCALAGSTAFAALATQWPALEPSPTAEEIQEPASAPFRDRRYRLVRSRGPPHLPS